MPDYRRLHAPGGTYFFTLNLADRTQDLLVRHIDALRAAWTETRTNRPFQTIAAVILPDHMHMVVSLPDGDDDFPTRIRLFKSGFTRRLPECLKSDHRKGQRGIWQKRYWEHLIRDDEDLGAHVEYVHHNPVKHGHVTERDHWPHSTWHRWKAEQARPIEPPKDWTPPPDT